MTEQELEQAARETRLEYFREWRKKNKDRVQKNNQNYWRKKAKEKLANEQMQSKTE